MAMKELVALESKLDAVLFRSMQDDEDGGGVSGKVKAGAGAAVVGAGALALRKRYAGQRPIPNAQEALAPESMRPKIGDLPAGRQVREIGRSTMRDLKGARDAAQAGVRRAGAYGKNIAGELGKAGGYFRSARAGGDLLGQGVGGALKTTVKRIARGVRGVGFSAEQALVELDARLDEALEFAEENNRVARALLGGPISSAIVAPKGQKVKAYVEQYKHGMKETGRGVKQGAGPGAILGAGLGAGALVGRLNRGGMGRAATAMTKAAGRKALGKRALTGALIGAAAGGYTGGLVGGAKGRMGSDEIHQRARRGEL